MARSVRISKSDPQSKVAAIVEDSLNPNSSHNIDKLEISRKGSLGKQLLAYCLKFVLYKLTSKETRRYLFDPVEKDAGLAGDAVRLSMGPEPVEVRTGINRLLPSFITYDPDWRKKKEDTKKN